MKRTKPIAGIGLFRHAAPPQNFGRKRGTADMAIVASVNQHDVTDPSQTSPVILATTAFLDEHAKFMNPR